MTARLKQQLDLMLPPVPLGRRPTARELLHALTEHADLECFSRDGLARVVIELPPDILDALLEWDADAPEDDQIDEAIS